MRDARRRCVELDRSTLEQLRPFLTRLAWRAVRDRAHAEDLVQEALLAALDPRTVHDPSRGQLRSFVAGILMRKVADHFRRRKRERTNADFDEELDSPRDFAPFDPARTLHPIDRARAMRVVETALLELPDQQRLAVLACDVEGLDRSAAAEALGITEGHLRVVLHRARHRLRKALEDARMR